MSKPNTPKLLSNGNPQIPKGDGNAPVQTYISAMPDGWFIAMYCYKKYVQLTFMNGDSLAPVPPKASKVEGTRYLDIYEEDELDEDQIMDWITQASKLPGTRF